MGCHDQRNNPQGVPLCQTGNEYMEGGSKVACQSCHMAVTGGLSDHSMGGGHSPGMLKRSLVFTLAPEGKPGKLSARVRLQNLQPHAMPTGAPFRNLQLRLTAYDAKGEVVWQNAKGHPSKDDPQAYFSYQMVDDKGMPAPPPTATKAGADTRLKPHEVRELTYEIPGKDIALIRGELYYALLWPALAEKFRDLPQELRDPVLIGVAEATVKSP